MMMTGWNMEVIQRLRTGSSHIGIDGIGVSLNANLDIDSNQIIVD